MGHPTQQPTSWWKTIGRLIAVFALATLTAAPALPTYAAETDPASAAPTVEQAQGTGGESLLAEDSGSDRPISACLKSGGSPKFCLLAEDSGSDAAPKRPDTKI